MLYCHTETGLNTASSAMLCTCQTHMQQDPQVLVSCAECSVDGFTFLPNKDSSGSDIRQSEAVGKDLAAECRTDHSCKGYNTGGWLKAAIAPVDELLVTEQQHGDVCAGVYAKDVPRGTCKSTCQGFSKAYFGMHIQCSCHSSGSFAWTHIAVHSDPQCQC